MNNSILLKVDAINEDLGDESLLLDQENEMFLLNPTAKFLWENCDGKNVNELAQLLYDQCTDKETLDFSEIQSDCLEAVDMMKRNGFIKIKN